MDDGKAFDERQSQRKRVLDRVLLASQVVAVLYLAIHLNTVWLAYLEDGALNALLTLAALGFGDLYWGLRWSREAGQGWPAAIALFAAVLCFTSWATRRRFNRWVNAFTADMLKDASAEFERMSQQADANARERDKMTGRDFDDSNPDQQ